MKVGIYCRISIDKKGKDKSIEDQSMLGKDFCTKNSYDFELYIDEGISGTIDDRPEFQRLLADVIEYKIQIIWVYDDSRIQRNPEIRYLLNNTLKNYKVQYYTNVNGNIDLFNPESDLMGGIMAEFNKYFVALTKIKVKSVLRRRALSGRGWGMPPYGYMYDENGYFILNDDESIIVRLIFDLSLQGMGTDAIARKLNGENVPTRYNKYSGEIRLHKRKGKEFVKSVNKKDIKWAGNTIRGILNNTMFFGQKKIQNIPFKVPGLFDVKYWEKVNYNLKNKNKNTKSVGGKLKYEYLLNRIIICGRCGRNYNGKTRANKKDHHYYCMSKRNPQENCGNRSINIDKIEELVGIILFHQRGLASRIRKDIVEGGSINAQKLRDDENIYLIAAEKRKENILDMIENGAISIGEVKERIEKINSEIKKHTDNIQDIENTIKDAGGHDFTDLFHGLKFYSKLSFEQKRGYIHKYIKNIVVYWINEKVEDVNVNYYIIKVIFKRPKIVQYFTNGYGLDMDTWFKFYTDEITEGNLFDQHFKGKNSKSPMKLPYYFEENRREFTITTLVPYGNVADWDEKKLISLYGPRNFVKYQAELEHKIRFNLNKLQ